MAKERGNAPLTQTPSAVPSQMTAIEVGKSSVKYMPPSMPVPLYMHRRQRVSPRGKRIFWGGGRETAEAYRQLNERLTENQNMLRKFETGSSCQPAEEGGKRFSEWRARRPTFGEQ